MPKSKNAKRINLTQTSKKDREFKSKIISDVREALDEYDGLFLFTYDNMRSTKFKEVRQEFRDGRVFMGKNKLLQLALGHTEEDEYKENMSQLSKHCKGSVGLLMTSRPKAEVLAYFEDFSSLDFARAGSTCTRTVMLTQDELEIHPVSMVDQFRKLGVPVHVLNGKVTLVTQKPHQICKEGRVLSAEECKLLCHFGVKLAVFKIKVCGAWFEGGDVETY